MKRHALLLLLAVALVTAGVIGWQRVGYEKANKTVELVADYRGFSELVTVDLTIEDILLGLKSIGIERVALDEWSLAQQIINNNPSEYYSVNDRANLAEPVGFNPGEVSIINQAGLAIVPRLEKNELLALAPSDKLTGFTYDLIIFNGNNLHKYPIVLEQGIRIGIVEFANQQGIAFATPDNAVRVHGITEAEIELLSERRILTRYLRAVKERNIRVLYIRPLAGSDTFNRTQNLVEQLKTELVSNGYQLGIAEPFGKWQPPIYALWLIFMGIIAGSIMFLLKWAVISDKWIWPLLIFGGIIAVILPVVNTAFAQQGFALLTAIVFPVLAITQVYQPAPKILAAYIKTTLIACAGSLLIIGCLSSTDYLVNLMTFRGVKLMHTVPIGLAFLYGLLQNELPFTSFRQVKQVLFKWLNYRIAVKYLLGLAVVGLGFLLYLLRTDNFIVFVPEFEIMIREGLEKILVVRPRTKEFLLGHPALVLLLAAKHKHPILVSIAVIGQLSLINTFTHIHTPIMYSLLRSFYGLLFGYLIGLMLLKAYLVVKGRVGNGSYFRLLRLP